MDEPFVSLDYDRRISQQQHLLNSWEKTNSTVLLVSHEIDEAIYLSDRLVLLSQRPAKVLSTYEITLPRPRTIEMLGQEAFFKLKVPILHDFMGIIGR
jgi:NitT/TauT family transport system ATP-binding protein